MSDYEERSIQDQSIFGTPKQQEFHLLNLLN